MRYFFAGKPAFVLSKYMNHNISCLFFFFFQSQAEDRGVDRILQEIDFSPLYYTRTRGLFRECFPGEKSNAPQGDLGKCYFNG